MSVSRLFVTRLRRPSGSASASGPSGWSAGAAAALPAATVLLIAAALGGCTQVGGALNPVVGQLDEFQQAKAAGRWQRIADARPTPDCKAGVAGCARLYAIHAEAHHHLAFDSRARDAVCPGSAASAHLSAAAQEFADSRAFGDGSTDAADQARLRALRTQALYCLAENAPTIDEGARLAHEADAEAAALPRAQGLLWQAMARLYLARPGAGSPAQRCQAVRSAADAATQAHALGAGGGVTPEDDRLLARIQHDSGLRQATLTGCAG